MLKLRNQRGKVYGLFSRSLATLSLPDRPASQPGITYRDTNRRKWNFLPSRRQAGQPDDGLIDVAGPAVRHRFTRARARVSARTARAVLGRRVLIARGDVCC